MRYHGAIWHPSTIHHPKRTQTRGIVEHQTYGHLAGDLEALDGPSVDVHFYVTKSGAVYQLLDTESMAWHAFATANDTCIGIEHENMGEPLTKAQLRASARLNAWLIRHHPHIKVKHVHPRDRRDGADWWGEFDHKDLSAAGIDGNTHSDGIPSPGWEVFLSAIRKHLGRASGKLAPLWQLVARGHVIWHRRIKRPPGWVTEITREDLDARLVQHR